MSRSFGNKQEARQYVWDTLQQQKIARFPFPPHDRIPNFKSAQQAARRLLDHKLVRDATNIKVNPDSPQRYVREGALQQGITVYMPTPRLRSGFKKFDPDKIPEGNQSDAASLSKGAKFAVEVSLEDLPQMDVIVSGSVAVTRSGKRCGKGHGYSDLEYAILRELGHPEVPVFTSVHELQIVQDFPRDQYDIPLSYIFTPEDTIKVEMPHPAPEGIDWNGLPEDALQKMPVLKELRKMQP